MGLLFNIVYALLMLLSMVTGLTYQEINIIVYYVLIPFIYLALFDKIFNRHLLKIIFGVGVIILCVLIKDLRAFSNWLFGKSVNFLLGFEKIGWNYIVASVIVCVIIPGIIFLVLFYFAFKTRIHGFFKKH